MQRIICCLAIAFMGMVFPGLSPAQTRTPAEKQCVDAIQGKVAWDLKRQELKTWGDDNLTTLCTATSDPAATVACFQSNLAKLNNSWQAAIAECKATLDASHEKIIAGMSSDRYKVTRRAAFLQSKDMLGELRMNTSLPSCLQACVDDKRCLGFAYKSTSTPASRTTSS